MVGAVVAEGGGASHAQVVVVEEDVEGSAFEVGGAPGDCVEEVDKASASARPSALG